MAQEAGGDEMESVKNYFNTAGFERWNKIYGTTQARRPCASLRLAERRRLHPPLCPMRAPLPPPRAVERGADVPPIGCAARAGGEQGAARYPHGPRADGGQSARLAAVRGLAGRHLRL